jgi:hypothetical protein
MKKKKKKAVTCEAIQHPPHPVALKLIFVFYQTNLSKGD